VCAAPPIADHTHPLCEHPLCITSSYYPFYWFLVSSLPLPSRPIAAAKPHAALHHPAIHRSITLLNCDFIVRLAPYRLTSLTRIVPQEYPHCGAPTCLWHEANRCWRIGLHDPIGYNRDSLRGCIPHERIKFHVPFQRNVTH